MSRTIKGGGRVHTLEPVAAVLLTAGGLIVLVPVAELVLVAVAELDLAARITGQDNALSRIVYALVGLVAVYGITQFTSRNANQAGLRSASAGA